MLSITNEGGHLCPEGERRYLPGDVVRGVVKFRLTAPFDIITADLLFLGEQQCILSSSNSSDGYFQVPLFRAAIQLCSSGRLAPGTHSWPFAFQFPQLPYERDVSTLQSRYPASFLYKSTGKAAALLTRYILSARVRAVAISDQVVEKQLMFWPTRQITLDTGPMSQPLPGQTRYYEIPRSKLDQGKKRFGMFEKSTRVGLLATLHVPKLHIIGDQLPLQLDLQVLQRQKPTDGEELPPCVIKRLRFELHAVTVVGGIAHSTLQQSNAAVHCFDVANLPGFVPVARAHSTADATKRINIHDLLPPDQLKIGVAPWKGMGTYLTDPLPSRNPTTIGPVVPSFTSPLCKRRYFIDTSIVIEAAGKSQTFNMRSKDIFLLPDRIDTNYVTNTPLISEIDQGREVGRYEAPGHEIVEAGGVALLGELDTRQGKVAELPTSPPWIFELDAGPVRPEFLN